MHYDTLALALLLAGTSSAHQNLRRQAYGSDYTTFTTLCESTINGTVATATHTHSKSIPQSPVPYPLSTGGTSVASASTPSLSGHSSPYQQSGGSPTSSCASSQDIVASASVPASSVVQPNTHGATTYKTTASPSLPTYSYEPSHTTYTTLCETTVNGTIVQATHTHSKVVSPSGYGPSLTSNAAYSGKSNTNTANATCGGQTLNVLGASLDWWYTHTYTYVASTIDILYDSKGVSTGWTVLPATTTFDITSAVLEPTCTSTLSYYPEYSTSLYSVSCFETPAPTAAVTSVITQTSYRPFTQTAGTGPLPSVATTAPPPVVTIPSSGGTFSAGTPFVFFSAYEIMTKYPTKYRNGSTGCAEATQTYTMKSPFSFEYEGEDVNGQKVVNAGVTGDVNPAFLGVVNVTAAIAGSWVAAPTVVVVMEKVVGAQAVLSPQTQTEISASVLQTPTPTLPAGIVPLKTTTTGLVIPTNLTPHRESTAESLNGPSFTRAAPTSAQQDTTKGQPVTDRPRTTVRPFTARIESTVVTLEIAVAPSQTVVTAEFSGHTVTAVAVSAAQTAGTGFGLGAILSAIFGQAKSPTNALEVLTAALSSPYVAPVNTAAAQIPIVTLGSSVYTANAATQYSLGPDAILTPGGKVMVDGSTVSLAPGATAIVINGVTSTLASPSVTPAPALTIDSTAYVGNEASAFEVNHHILTPGAQMTAAGTTYSLAPDGGIMVVNGVAHTIAAPATNAADAMATITAPPVLTIGGTVYGPNGGSSYGISGQTLTPGGEITLSGSAGESVISLDSAANTAYTILDSGSVTITSPIGSPATMAPVLTIDGQKFTAVNPALATYVIGGHTIVPGGSQQTVVVSGSTFVVSLEPQATMLVVEEPNSAGEITSTILETLFPGPMPTGSTSYMTDSPVSATGVTASPSSAPTSGLQNAGTIFGPRQKQALLALGLNTLVLAIWL